MALASIGVYAALFGTGFALYGRWAEALLALLLLFATGWILYRIQLK